MKNSRGLAFSLLVIIFTSVAPKVQAIEQYEASWRISNSEFPETSFTLWPTNMAGGQAFRTVYPICTVENTTDCIKSVEYQNDQNIWIAGRLLTYLPVDEDYETVPGKLAFKITEKVYSENPVKNSILPKSARSSVWSFPGITHSGGSEFLLTFQTFRSGTDTQLIPATSPTEISIVPISSFIQSVSKSEIDSLMPYSALISEAGPNSKCYYDPTLVKKYCTTRENFTNFKPIRVIVNLNKHADIFASIDWFTARTQDTGILVRKLVDGTSELTFQGIPISINSAVSYRPATVENYILGRKIMNIGFEAMALPGTKPAQLDLNQTKCFNPIPSNWIPECSTFADMTLHTMVSAEDPSGFITWRELEKYFPILPKDPVTVWNFKTMNPAGQDYLDLNRCSSHSEPSGVLSSNATLLVPSPPKWNKENQSLDYNLASTHLDANGRVVTGFYELRVSEKVAKCLWGDDLSQAKVQIQVVSSTDNSVQSLEVSTLQIKDGYINFRASGFHYSANKVELKIIGAKKVEASSLISESKTVEVPSSPKSQVIKQNVITSILCTKGKLTKKVTSVQPKCPAGYKKK